MSDGKRDTGLPGFGIDGKLHTYDVGDPDAQSVPSRPVDKVKVVDITDAFEENGKKKDLSKGTRTSLSQYLSDLTSGKEGVSKRPNSFPVSRPEVLRESSTETQDGYPSRRGQPESGYFDPNQDQSRSYSSNYPDIAQSISKGASPGGSPDGHKLLPSVEADIQGSADKNIPESNPVGRYTNRLLSNNRWTAASRRLPDFNDRTETDVIVPTPSDYGVESRNTKNLDQLKMVGPALTLRASGEVGGFSKPNSELSRLAAVVPSFTQLSLNRPYTSELEASAALEDLASDQPNVTETSISKISWGSMNNVNDRFDGLDSTGMTLLSVALILALSTVIGSLSFLLGFAVSPSTVTGAPLDILPFGKRNWDRADFDTSASQNLRKMLNLYEPENGEFFNLVRVGIVYFFGALPFKEFDWNAAGKDVLSFLKRTSLSQVKLSDDRRGYDIVTARAILRSALTIKDAFAGLGGAGGLISAGVQLVKIFETIRDSKIFAALNVFCKLGDRLADAARHIEEKRIEIEDTTTGISVAKSRLLNASLVDDKENSFLNATRGYTPSTKLAWSTSVTPSLYYMPLQLGEHLVYKNKNVLSDVEDIRSSLVNSLSPDPLGSNTTEFTEDDMRKKREELEGLLGSEYVPFYFHDMRTQELLSFHAFISEISDSYTANYESVDGLGRVESVKTYKNTSRQIQLAFFIAATGPDDFDEMWRKINKLTTFVYPQYTRGRQVKVDGGQTVFTQPFSQIAGASPLIRIRLGDLLRSNYNKLALARLFGAGTGDDGFKLGVAPPLTGEDIQAQRDKIKKEITRNPPKDMVYRLDGSIIAGNIPLRKSSNMERIRVPALAANYLYFSGWDGSSLDVVAPDPSNFEDTAAYTTARLAYDTYGFGNKFVTSLDSTSESGLVGVAFASNVILNKYIESKLPDPPPSTPSSVNEFFDAKNNAYVKFFEKNSGAGLAGTIDSMSFDWQAGVWKTGGFGGEKDYIAPKICKVTMGFTPIHDITPGIDHAGYNRSPIYPVGKFSGFLPRKTR